MHLSAHLVHPWQWQKNYENKARGSMSLGFSSLHSFRGFGKGLVRAGWWGENTEQGDDARLPRNREPVTRCGREKRGDL